MTDREIIEKVFQSPLEDYLLSHELAFRLKQHWLDEFQSPFEDYLLSLGG